VTGEDVIWGFAPALFAVHLGEQLSFRMFTGIVEEKGRVAAFTQGGKSWRLKLSARAALAGVARGDSIAVNGCCLTVTDFDAGAGTVEFDVLEETKRLTSFSVLESGSAVNLERSLRFDGKMGGHFVTGHIDGLGVIEILEKRGNDFYMSVRAPRGSGRYLIHKGSIAIDGISLTVAETEGDTLAVWLIPTTRDGTKLSEKRAGDPVNLEIDWRGKYVEKLVALRG
jgi:riboflavin synthase